MKLVKNILIFGLIVFLFGINEAFALQFNDVNHGFWAYKEIDMLSNKKIINNNNANFYPNNNITRAQFCTMVIKALKLENMNIDKMYTFEDVDNTHWAWKYIIRAVNLGIVKGDESGNFYPDGFITRSEVIKFLVNLLRTEDITKKDAINALQNNYLDYDEIPDWFKLTAGKAEVINVIAKEPPREQYLDYDRYVSRAQAAVFIANMIRVTDSYEQEKIKEETSPKIGEGIIIENVIRDGDVVTLPQKTVLPIVITGQLSSKDAQSGQMFQARFPNNIVDYEHNILLSKDIILIGKVLDVKKAKNFINNGELIFELSAVNKNNLLTRIIGYSECEAPTLEANKIKKITKTISKGRDFTAKDGQILYVKLFKQMRVNIVTGEVLD